MDHRYAGHDRAQRAGKFDKKAMTLEVEISGEDDEGCWEETVTFPAKMEVCDTCEGKGTHVNPSIDSHGITSDEWAEWDDDDREGYFNGRYDVQCYECHGENVVPVVDEERCSGELLEKLQQYNDNQIEQAQMDACERREREMGY